MKPLAALLYEKADVSVEAWEDYQMAIKWQKEMQAVEELAKLEVWKRYEHNWLEARKEFGIAIADSLYLKVSLKSRQDDDKAPAARNGK